MARNPFRSEAEAFRFLLLTLAAFAVIAVAAAIGGAQAAVPVWAAASVVAIAVYVRRGRPQRPLRSAPAHVGAPEERRLLLLAQGTVHDDRLVEAIAARADRVLVVAPATAPTLQRWASDVDGAREEARERADATVARLRAANVDATGTVGDEDPLRAIEDALRTFGGDEILVATDDGDRADDEVARIRERYALPVSRL